MTDHTGYYTGSNPFDGSNPPPPNPSSNLSEESERLRRKEEELNQREDQLKRRGEILTERRKIGKEKDPPNWPRCRPIVYHNIQKEMQNPELVSLVRFGYGAWIFGQYALSFNSIALLVVLINGGKEATANIGGFVLSLIFMVLGTVLSFIIYRVLYRGGRKYRPRTFVLYFLLLWIEILCYALFALGWQGSGAGGFILMINMFKNKSTVAGIFLIVSCANWTILAIYGITIFIRARVLYSRAGGNQAAKQDLKNLASTQIQQHPEVASQVVQGMTA